MLMKKIFWTELVMLLATNGADGYSNRLFDIVCISLVRATDRREYITDFLSSMNLNYRLFNAVDGSAVLRNEQHISQYSNGIDMDCMIRKHLIVSRKFYGAVGLKFSNYILMREIERSESNRPVLILEDDVSFGNDIAEIIEDVIGRINVPWDIILLIPTFFTDPSRPHDSETGLKGMVSFYGTYGFIVDGCKAAKKLADYLEDCPVWHPIDNYYGDLMQQGKIVGYAFADSLVYHRSDLFKSTISEDESSSEIDSLFDVSIYPFRRIAEWFNK